MFKARLHPFYDIDGDIGDSSSVEETVETVSDGSAPTQETPDVEGKAESTESESSFARRLREHSEKAIKAEREKWEQETGEKYKDYDVLKTTAEFFRERHGYDDLLSMKEEIELVQLQARADREQVSPETLKRIDELEAKAAKADEMEQKQQEEQRVTTYFSTLSEFVKDKGVEPDALNQFMIENEMQYNPNNMQKSFDLALKAYKAEQLEKQLVTAKEDSIKEYLASKKAPRVEGSTGALGVQTVDTSKLSWKDLEKHAASRLEASKTPQ